MSQEGYEGILQAIAAQGARFDNQFSQLSSKMEAQTEASARMEARIEAIEKSFGGLAEKVAVQSLEQHMAV